MDKKLTYDYYICVKLYRDESDVVITELKKKDAYLYLSDDVRELICENFNCSDLYLYFHNGDSIEDMELELLGTGIARIHVTLRSELSKEEQEELQQFLSVQMYDGWGEGIGSEVFVHEDNKGRKAYSVSFLEKQKKSYVDKTAAKERRKETERKKETAAPSPVHETSSTCRYCGWYDREVEENGLKFCRNKKEFTAVTSCEFFIPIKNEEL